MLGFKYPTAHEIVAEYLRQLDNGTSVTQEDVIGKHRRLEEELRAEFHKLDLISSAVSKADDDGNESSSKEASDTRPRAPQPARPTVLRCPHCNRPTEARLDGSFRAVECESCGKHFSLIRERQWPKQISHFELVERIGMGGFGSVWKARDTELNRFVAIKLPRRVFLEESEQEQFLREAQTVAQLNHPNIVKVHEVGVHDGSIYIVSELIEGQPLSHHIADGLSEKATLELAEPIARALHYAHECGVIHRDLKPQNVIVGGDGKPYLSDFGLARRGDTDLTLTVSGQILGTPRYMSPEQARGDSRGADERSDIFSFGILLYELLTGRVPFQGTPEMIFYRVQTEDPVHPYKLRKKISLDVDTICMKCLEKDPEKRYQTAQQVAEELHRAANGTPIHARPVGMVERVYRWAKRNPAVASLAAGLIVAFVGATLLGSYLFAQMQFTKNIHQRRLLADIRHLRTDGKSGYRHQIFEILKDNPELIRDEEFTFDLRREALLCMGDFAAFEVRSRAFPDMNVTTAAISTDGSQIAIGFDGRIEVRDTEDLEQVLLQVEVSDLPMAIHFRGKGQSQHLLSIGQRGAIDRISFDGDALAQRLSDVRELPLKENHELGGKITSASFSPNGRFVVFTDGAGVVLWDVDRKEAIFEDPWELSGIDARSVIRCVAVSSDGATIAAGHSDDLGGVGGVIRWNLVTGKVDSRKLTGAQSERSIAISDDGQWIVVGCERAVLYETKTLESRLFFQDAEVKALAFCPNSNYVAIDYNSGVVEIRNHRTNSRITQIHEPKDSYNNGVAFSGDGNRFLMWNRRSIQSLDLSNHTERIQIDYHERAVPALHFSDNERLVSCSKDGSVRAWDPCTGRQKAAIEGLGQIQCIATHPTEPWIAIGQWQSTDSLTIWRFSDTVEREKLLTIPNDLGMICGLGFTGDGTLLVASGDKGLRVWSIETDGMAASTLYWPAENSVPDNERSASEDEPKNEQDKCLVLDNSGQRVFHANVWGDDIKCLDLRTTPPESRHVGGVGGSDMLIGWHGLAFTPDNHLVFVSPDRSLDIWDVEDMSSGGRRVRSIAQGRFSDSNIAVTLADVNHIDKDPLVAVKTGPKTVSIWNLSSGLELYTFREERNTVYSLAWSPDGQRLAVGLSDGGISIWDIAKVRRELSELGFAKQ